jgi:protease-4
MSILHRLKTFVYGLFGKKPAPVEEKRKTLTTVMDSYVRVMNVNNTLKTLMILVAVVLMFTNMLTGGLKSRPTDHVAVIKIAGAIQDGSPTGSGRSFAEAFDRATKDGKAKAILIMANSGGGSPVQAEIMNKVIADYTAKPLEERLPVIVSMQEICASACIMATSHADEIYSHGNTIVGSISVRMDGWAIDNALQRIDIQRKVLKTGIHKDLLDPYRNITAEERAFIQSTLMQPLHDAFVSTVKSGRGDKLDLSNELLFTGMVWSGFDSKQVGLIDDIKTSYELENELKVRYSITDFKDYNTQRMSIKDYLLSSVDTAVQAAVKTAAAEMMNNEVSVTMSVN